MFGFLKYILFKRDLKYDIDIPKEWYIKLYRNSCVFYIALQKYLKQPLLFLVFIITVLIFLLVEKFKHEYDIGLITSISITVAITTIYLLLKAFVDKGLYHSGFQNKLRFPGNNLIVRSMSTPCQIDTANINTAQFVFASHENIDLMSLLNVKLYSKTLWYDSVDRKRIRNQTHIEKNKHCILLIYYRGVIEVGFTHIIPVTEDTWFKYISGKIGDKDYSDYHVYPSAEGPNEAKEDKPYGLILFSVGYLETREVDKNSNMYHLKIGELLEQAIAFHLEELYKRYFTGKKKVPVLIQTIGNDSIIKFFKPCTLDGDHYSYDKNKIIIFEVSLKN